MVFLLQLLQPISSLVKPLFDKLLLDKLFLLVICDPPCSGTDICAVICMVQYMKDLSLTWMAAISTRRVVQDDNTGQVIVYYRQVFNITT